MARDPGSGLLLPPSETPFSDLRIAALGSTRETRLRRVLFSRRERQLLPTRTWRVISHGVRSRVIQIAATRSSASSPADEWIRDEAHLVSSVTGHTMPGWGGARGT
jgi:hypothetical protein